MSSKHLLARGAAAKRPGSYEFSAAGVSAASVGSNLDPVLNIDHFHIRAPFFAPHPHAGFSAVTYLFEDGEGEFVNRDSLGHELIAQPGAVIWTVTGSGLLHNEYPRQRGQLSHGLQIFVNLPQAEKAQPPRVMFVDGPDVPVLEKPGLRARVVAGSLDDVQARLEAPGGITFLDVELAPGTAFEPAFDADQSVLVYVIAGGLHLQTENRPLQALEAASFSAEGDSIWLQATGEGAHFVLIAGHPLRERVVSYGPFVMSSEEEIAAAFERYQSGRMGHLEAVN